MTDLKFESDWQLASLFFALAHALSLPSLLEKKPWFKRKKDRNHLLLNTYPNRSLTRIDLLFKTLWHLLVLAFSCAVSATFITGGLLYLASAFMLIEKAYIATLWIIIFVGSLPIGIWVMRSDQKKRNRRL